MFLDASAIVEILTDGPQALPLARKANATTKALVSPVTVAEAAIALASLIDADPAQAEEIVTDFLNEFRVQTIPIPHVASHMAIEAHARYAGLSLAECLTYASARYYRVPLLYHDAAGTGFSRTDIQPA